MPFINVKVTEEVSEIKQKAIKTKLGKAIELLPGKSESYLMISIEPESIMYFKGDNSLPCAFAEVEILGKATKSDYGALAAEICDILSDELNIPADRTYVKFEETAYWGYNGFMF